MFVQPSAVLLPAIVVLLALLFSSFCCLPLRSILEFPRLGCCPSLRPLLQLAAFVQSLLFSPFCTESAVRLLFRPTPRFLFLLLPPYPGFLLGPGLEAVAHEQAEGRVSW